MRAGLLPSAERKALEGRSKDGGSKDSEGRGIEALVQRKMEGRKREPVRIFEKQGCQEVPSEQKSFI